MNRMAHSVLALAAIALPGEAARGPEQVTRILDLRAEFTGRDSIRLTWTVPVDQGTDLAPASYEVRSMADEGAPPPFVWTSAQPTSSGNYENATGEIESVVVTSLPQRSPVTGGHLAYAIGIRSYASNGASSQDSNIAQALPDTVPPEVVTDIEVASSGPGSLLLEFLPALDPVGLSGDEEVASDYLIGSSTTDPASFPTLDAWWASADKVERIGLGAGASGRIRVSLGGLEGNRDYHLAVIAQDTAPNPGPLPSATTAGRTLGIVVETGDSGGGGSGGGCGQSSAGRPGWIGAWIALACLVTGAVRRPAVLLLALLAVPLEAGAMQGPPGQSDSPIPDVQARFTAQESIMLSWTAPTPSDIPIGDTVPRVYYEIRAMTSDEISSPAQFAWNEADPDPASPLESATSPGQVESFSLSGYPQIPPGAGHHVTYYFSVRWKTGETGMLGDDSNIATALPDVTPPGAVLDLAAVSSSSNSIGLEFSPALDPVGLSGGEEEAADYRFGYSTAGPGEFDSFAAWWAAADKTPSRRLIPGPGGRIQALLEGLRAGSRYSIVAMALDSAPNEGAFPPGDLVATTTESTPDGSEAGAGGLCGQSAARMAEWIGLASILVAISARRASHAGA